MIMNFLVMPLYFLSGAMFPLSTAPSWMKGLMVVDPLTVKSHVQLESPFHWKGAPDLNARTSVVRDLMRAGHREFAQAEHVHTVRSMPLDDGRVEGAIR